MNFVYILSVSQSLEKYRRMIVNANEIKLLARAGITCCFLNGRGFRSVHEVGVSLIYVYILLSLESVPLKNVAVSILISFLFMVCMHLSLQIRRSKLAAVLCSIFSVADLFATIKLSSACQLPYIFGVSLFSISILIVLYIDGRKRPGIKQCIFKDVSLLAYFILKNTSTYSYTYYPYVVSAIILIWMGIESIKNINIVTEIVTDVSDEHSIEIAVKVHSKPRRKAAVKAVDAKTNKTPVKVSKRKERETLKKPSEKEIPQRDHDPIPRITKSAMKIRPTRAAAKEARLKITK